MKNIRLDQKLKQEEIDDLVRQLEVPLPFAFQDGKIEHVCSSPQETQHSQNIKRGILSAMVNTMDNLKQSQDVKEVCQKQFLLLIIIILNGKLMIYV